MALPTLAWPEWDETPEALDFVLPGLLAGTVGALISPGGGGKSMLILQLMLLVSSSIDLLGLGTDWRTGPVVYLPAEDPGTALRHRLHSLKAHLSRDQYERARESIAIRPLVGLMPDLNDRLWYDKILDATQGCRLLVIDTLRRFHRGDENHTGEMAEVIARLEAIAQASGSTIVFLHHAGKAASLNGQGDQQQASRGSSVLVDNIRWQAFLVGMTAENAKELEIDLEQRGYYAKFGLSKTNYGRPVAETWLKRQDGGILLPAKIVKLERLDVPSAMRSRPGRGLSGLDVALGPKGYRAASRGG